MDGEEPVKNLAEELAEALGGVIPQDCPNKEKPAEGLKTHTLPDQAKKLVPIWHRLQKKSATLVSNGSGNDGGVWFRHHNEVDAIKVFIDSIIRTDRHLSYRHRFDLFANWQYSEDGA